VLINLLASVSLLIVRVILFGVKILEMLFYPDQRVVPASHHSMMSSTVKLVDFLLELAHLALAVVLMLIWLELDCSIAI
jgi:hypothetical protein